MFEGDRDGNLTRARLLIDQLQEVEVGCYSKMATASDFDFLYLQTGYFPDQPA